MGLFCFISNHIYSKHMQYLYTFWLYTLQFQPNYANPTRNDGGTGQDIKPTHIVVLFFCYWDDG